MLTLTSIPTVNYFVKWLSVHPAFDLLSTLYLIVALSTVDMDLWINFILF